MSSEIVDLPPCAMAGVVARALAELDIEWIAAHSPRAKGRIERLFGVLEDRLVKEMRLQQRYVEGFATRSGIRAKLEIAEPLGPLGKDIDLVLFRFFRNL